MKKLLWALTICLIIIGCKQEPAKAGELSDLITKLPVTNAGVYYNLNDSKFEFTSTFQALNYKGFNLNIGYATPESLVASLGYEIVKLEKFGVKLPILKDLIIDAGWTLGWEEPLIDREFNNGPNITLKWKW